MMILFDGHSLTAKTKFQPEKLSLQLSERGSTASMTVADTAPVMSVDDWLKIEDGPGAGVMWRVRSIDTQFDRKTRTINLEHVINSLRDNLMFGEVKTSDISGRNANPTAAQAVRYILNKSADWTTGTVDFNVTNPYEFNGDDLFSALETVTRSLKDAYWSYDFSAYPFKLSILKYTDTVASEMRTDRNITTLRKTIDRSRMYTRIYPIGKNNLHIDGNYVQKNTGLYGLVCKCETDQSLDTKEKLQAWAQERLERHCEPSVTVTISGLELVEATGEPLDRFRIGTMCRIPLPEFGTTITERVTRLSYSDVIRDPYSVTITLANELQDVATILKQQAASSGKSSRAKAKKDKEDHAWFVDTTDHVSMVAEAVAGPGAASDWSRVSSCVVDGDGIHQQVQKTQGELVAAEGRIDVSEEKIALVVEKKNGQNVIKAANICAAINGDGKSVIQINADKIALTGQTKLNDVLTVLNGMAVFTKPVVFGDASGSASVQSGIMKADGFQIHSGNAKYNVGYADLGAMIKTASVSGNTLTLTRWDGTTVNFNRAVTSYLSSWSDGVLTITPVPQGEAKFKVGFSSGTDVRLEVATNGTPTASSAGAAWVDAPLAVNEITGQTQPVTRYTVTKAINATPAYNNGKKAATVTLSYGTVVVDSNYQKHVTFSATNDSNTSNKDTMVLYLVLGSGKAQLRKTSATGTIIMEINTN